MELILDFGSGNTCHNDPHIIRQMIWELGQVDTGKHDIIIKWQLFKSAPPNIPLDYKAFAYAYKYAYHLGYKTTSSVFDIDSMRFLMQFDVPFVKIACRPELYDLAQYSTVPVYVSTSQSGLSLPNATVLACIPKYPASIADYEAAFSKEELRFISDHTIGWELAKKYQPDILEKHYVHMREAGNPDAGPFAVTPDDLEGII